MSCVLFLFMLHTQIVTVHDSFFIFFNDTATTEIYTLSLHDALPISIYVCENPSVIAAAAERLGSRSLPLICTRSEEHTSELQSLRHLVCRLLLEKKKTSEQLANTETATPSGECSSTHHTHCSSPHPS